MCLIVTGPANKIRDTLLNTPHLLKDIFDSNKDGIGAMYASDDGVVIVNKALPADLAQARAFIEQLPDSDRDLALHFRMRTHGDIDLENCHPYPVIDGQLHMMHNGVIRGIDDSSDKTKSDTWHYIERVLKPQLQAAPDLINVEAWRRLVGRDVESGNKLVLMNGAGDLVTVNHDSGIEHDGMWFSNEYAWSPEILMPHHRVWSSRGYDWRDDEGTPFSWTGGSGAKHTQTQSTTGAPKVDSDALWTAVGFGDADEVYKFLDEYPITTLAILFENDYFVCSVDPKTLAAQDAKIVGMLEDGEKHKLNRYCRKSAGRCRKVAEIIAWYGSWVDKYDGEVRTMESTAEAAAEQHPTNCACSACVPSGDLDAHRLYLERSGRTNMAWRDLKESTRQLWRDEAKAGMNSDLTANVPGDTIENTGGVTDDEADYEVIEGQVVPIRQSVSSEEENADEADLNTWRADFHEWLKRQGYIRKEAKQVAALVKPAAKWSAASSQNQFPTSENPPAKVAVVKSRTINYRGHRIEVPVELIDGTTSHWQELREFLEKTAAHLDEQAKKTASLGVDDSHTDESEAHSDLYAG